ncbi:MAG: hypothetical protein NUV72_06610 [Bauldia sp.]|nr:hypothetical protein [Bauldia sp.]
MRRILTGLILATALTAPAFATDYGSTPPPAIGYHHHHFAVLPECGDPAVIATIPEKFAYQDARITMTGLAIASIDGIHQHALRAGGPGLIDRRYCGATAWLSNGRRSEIVYLIEGPKVGFASIGWHVESCLPGFDPYRVYDARCRSIRP